MGTTQSKEKDIFDLPKKGDVTAVQSCVDSGVDMNAGDENGWTPLHWASHNGHVDAVKMLIEQGAAVDAIANQRSTPLHVASLNGHVDAVNMLIDLGAAVGATTNVHVLVTIGYGQLICEQKGSTPLHLASLNGHVDAVKMLIERGAAVDVTDEDQWTPLHWASLSGHVDAVKMLIELGAAVGATTNDGWTPLHWVSLNGHVDAVKILIEKGADVDATDKNGWTPLHWASHDGHVDAIKMLIELGAAASATANDGWTPLHWASENGHVDAVKMLIEQGAAVDATDKIGCTPLHIASLKGHSTVVETLLAARADLFAILQNGQTPRTIAEENNHTAVVCVLNKFAQERALAYFCAGDHALAEKHATFSISALKDHKSAYACIGDSLHQLRMNKQAKAAFELGLKRNPLDVDCAAGLKSIQLTQAFTPGAVRRLATAEDPSIQTFLQREESNAIFGSVVDNPTIYYHHQPLLEPILTYLVSLEQVTPGGQPQDVAIPAKCTTNLVEAAKTGDLANAQACVAEGAAVNWRGELGDTPLHWASWNGHPDVVKMLLENGANVNAADVNGETPLHWASMNGQANVVNVLVEHGATVDTSGWTPLHHVAFNGHDCVAAILINKGATVDAIDEDGWTPLHLASKWGHVKAVQGLLAAAASLFATTKVGMTPRDVAAAGNHTAIVDALDQCAQDRPLTYFCAGDHALAEKHATLVITARALNTTAFAWIGGKLHHRDQLKKALEAFDMGKQADPRDITCLQGSKDVKFTMQVAKAFGHDDVFATLIQDERMDDYLRDTEFASIVRSVHASPSQYDRSNKRLVDVFEFLQLHDKTRAQTRQPSSAPPPEMMPPTQDTPITTLPVKASLADLTKYLRLPGTPKIWRLSDTYNLVTDLVIECNHCIFKAENPNRRHAQLVVKLTDQEAEVTFCQRMRDREDAAHVSNVVECFQVCPVPMAAGAAKCFALVMERGEQLDNSHLDKLRSRPLLGLECIQNVANALEFLHSQNVIHGDVKLENVVHFSNVHGYKLIDFDHTIPIASAMRLHCTYEYCPPEMARLILQRDDHATMAASPTFDVWCLGVLALKLFADGGRLEQFGEATDDGILKIVAAPEFTFLESVSNLTQLNTRQKKYLLKCLDPDASKRTDNVRDILKLADIKSTSATFTAPSPAVETPCQLPCLWTLAILHDKRRMPRGAVLRGLHCRVGVVNSLAAACAYNQDNVATVLAGSAAVAMALPFFRVLKVYLDVLDALEDHRADVATLKVSYAPADSIKDTIEALESIHSNTPELAIESQLREFDTRLLHDMVAPEEVEDIRQRVDRALHDFATSPDTLALVAALLASLGQLRTETAPAVVGGLVEQVNSATNRPTWTCQRHNTTPHAHPIDTLGVLSVPEPSDFPMLWSLESVGQLGSRIRFPNRLRRERFRLVLQCEWCESACKRESHQGDAPNDAKLEFMGDSDAIRELLPMLKVSSLVLKALCVASLAGLTLDGFKFDRTKVELGSQIIAAMEKLHGPTPSLDCEATFASILSRLDSNDSDDAEMAVEVKKLHVALMAYRVAVAPRMKQLLDSLKFDWTRQRVGGLHQVTLSTCHSRWVCDTHVTAP